MGGRRKGLSFVSKPVRNRKTRRGARQNKHATDWLGSNEKACFRM